MYAYWYSRYILTLNPTPIKILTFKIFSPSISPLTCCHSLSCKRESETKVESWKGLSIKLLNAPVLPLAKLYFATNFSPDVVEIEMIPPDSTYQFYITLKISQPLYRKIYLVVIEWKQSIVNPSLLAHFSYTWSITFYYNSEKQSTNSHFWIIQIQDPGQPNPMLDLIRSDEIWWDLMIRRSPNGFLVTEIDRIPSDKNPKLMKCYKFDKKSCKLFYRYPI